MSLGGLDSPWPGGCFPGAYSTALALALSLLLALAVSYSKRGGEEVDTEDEKIEMER